MPFSEEELSSHFFDYNPITKSSKHLNTFFEKPINDYKKLMQGPLKYNQNMKNLQTPCRIEKDEKFWTASTLMNLFHSDDKVDNFSKLFKKAYNLEKPPLKNISTWEECFEGDLDLRFEVHLSSPRSYLEWLQKNKNNRQIIPYMKKGNHQDELLERLTHIDAVIFNNKKRFAAFIEAKVLSDMSIQVINDMCRNQLARMIDVIMEQDDGRINHDPEKSLILLLTPKLMKDEPSSRFYGCKYQEYKLNPQKIGIDLPHRKDNDCLKFAEKIGWITYEDCREIDSKCCPWLA